MTNYDGYQFAKAIERLVETKWKQVSTAPGQAAPNLATELEALRREIALMLEEGTRSSPG